MNIQCVCSNCRKDGSSAAPGEIVGRMAHTMVYHSVRVGCDVFLP